MRKIFAALSGCFLCTLLLACHQEPTPYGDYNHAIIRVSDVSFIEGDISSWQMLGDGRFIKVTIGSKTYLVESSNIILEHCE